VRREFVILNLEVREQILFPVKFSLQLFRDLLKLFNLHLHIKQQLVLQLRLPFLLLLLLNSHIVLELIKEHREFLLQVAVFLL